MAAAFNFVPVNVDGVEVINTTPHTITFGVGDGTVKVPSHILVNAAAVETKVHEEGGVEFVNTTFLANDKNRDLVIALQEAFPGAVIVGSIIAAQAFPGKVVAMTPCSGFERVPPAEKRMNPKKFTTFAKH